MHKRVLVCDDEFHIRQTTEFVLKRAGFEILCAADGQQGWELFQQYHPDILVTDFQMPGMNGAQLVQRIRESHPSPKIPVVMITGKAGEFSGKSEFEQLQVAALIAKPFSPHELLHCVQRLIETAVTQNGLAFR